ncbi:hypothetical protein DL95DRAFT_302928, partial [Leptodontidium sp. 2 PMI_412]
IPAIINLNNERAAKVTNYISGIYIITSSSKRKGIISIRGAIFDTYGKILNRQPITFAITIRLRLKQNPYVAELEAIVIVI